MGTAPRQHKTCSQIVRLAALAAVGISLTACSWNEQRSETLGGVVGGVLGGVVGSKAGEGTGKNVAIVIGATLGTMWGQDIAKGLNDVDQIFHERTTTDTLEYGEPGEEVSWANPDSGNSGSVTAGGTYQNADGQDCRTFETTVNAEGEARTAEGVACRQDDGTWQIVEQPS